MKESWTEQQKQINNQFYKYNNAIVKLLDEGLKDGEYFVFRKTDKGGYGFVLSKEREEMLSIQAKSKPLELIENIFNTYWAQPKV